MMNQRDYKAKKFVEKILPVIKVDRGFQRNICWSDKTCREYIISVNRSRSPSPIVVSDIITGMASSDTLSDDVSLKSYKKAWEAGKSYISLDGMNRADALRKLFADELAISGTFIDADDAEVTIENTYYSKLPKRLQDALKMAEIPFCVMEGCLYDELHDIFLSINSGDALNPQEKRNAINSPISTFIRERSEQEKIKAMWPKISGMDERRMQRSLHAEWTIKAYMATLPGDKSYDLQPKHLDSFYSLGKNKEAKKVSQYSRKNLNRFCKIFNELATLVNGCLLRILLQEELREKLLSSADSPKINRLKIY